MATWRRPRPSWRRSKRPSWRTGSGCSTPCAGAGSRAPISASRPASRAGRFGELESAIAECDEARSLTQDTAAQARLDGYLEVLASELEPQRAAAQRERLNGWLALAVIAALLGAAAWVYRMSRIPEPPSVNVLVDAR